MATPGPQKPAAGTQQTPSAERLLIDLANQAAEEFVLLEIKEVSVSIPQRKKYDLVFTKNFLYAKLVNTTTPVQGMVFKWSEIGAYNHALPLCHSNHCADAVGVESSKC